MRRIGKLDQRVAFQSATWTADGAGGRTRTWSFLTVAPQVWAQVFPAGGGESFEEGRTTARAGYVFRIRRRADIDETMRIIWNGEAYDIRRVMRESPREPYMKIEAERGA